MQDIHSTDLKQHLFSGVSITQNLFHDKRIKIISNFIMMCGVCGSGKTTYAKQKEKMGMSDFSID